MPMGEARSGYIDLLWKGIILIEQKLINLIIPKDAVRRGMQTQKGVFKCRKRDDPAIFVLWHEDTDLLLLFIAAPNSDNTFCHK